MAIKVTCSSCDASYNVGDTMSGKKIRCRECEEPIVVPKGKGGDSDDRRRVTDRKGRAPVPAKTAALRRSRDEDDDDNEDEDEDEPRSRKKGKAAEKSAMPLVLIGGGAAAALVVGVVMFLVLGRSSDDSALPAINPTPVAQNPLPTPVVPAPTDPERTGNDEVNNKLPGIWEVTKGSPTTPPGATVEFTSDGKIKLKAKMGPKEMAFEGTYKIKQDTVLATLDFGGKSKSEANKIKKLTDNELILEDERGKIEEYKRLEVARETEPKTADPVPKNRDPEPPVLTSTSGQSGERVYQRLLKSTVWIRVQGAAAKPIGPVTMPDPKNPPVGTPPDGTPPSPPTGIIQSPNEPLAGTYWAGSESLVGYDRLAFSFLPGFKVTMIDKDGQTPGKYSTKGGYISIDFPGPVTYTGIVKATTMSGTASNFKTKWQWGVTRQAAVPVAPGVIVPKANVQPFADQVSGIAPPGGIGLGGGLQAKPPVPGQPPPGGFPVPPGGFPKPPPGGFPTPPGGFPPGFQPPGGQPPGAQPPSGGGVDMSTGSGALVDRKHRLVLTNVHVVGKSATVMVNFPTEDKGALQVKRDYYTARPGIRGTVVMREPRADIALVKLDSLPPGVQPLAFAKKPPRPAQQVHSVGNPGASGALWIYSPGKVRQVFHDKWQAVNSGERKLDSHEAMVIETDSPINAGDSGGPLVDDRGVLVGVAHGSSIGARNLSAFIEASECRALMEKYYKSIGETWVPEPEPVFQEDLARLPELIKKLSDKEFTVRLQAAQALGTMGESANLAFGALFGAMKDSEAIVRRAAADALGTVPPHKGDVSMLCQACKNADEPMEVRLQAVRSLALLGPEAKSAVPTLAERLKDADENLRQSAFKAIIAVGVEGKDVPLLADGLKSGNVEMRKLSSDALARLGAQAKPAVPALIECLKNSDKALRASAAKALAAIGPEAKQALPAIQIAMKDGEQGLEFLPAFLKLGGDAKEASGMLSTAIKNGSGDTRKQAIQVAGTLGANGKFAVNDLLAALDDDTIRADAVQALVAIVKPSAKAVKDGLTKTICQSMTKSRNDKTRLACVEIISEIGHVNQAVALALNLVYQRDPVQENKQAAMQAIQRLGKN